MPEAVGAVLGNAVGVALSPVPLIALVLMLLSTSAVANGLAFLGGWPTGIGALGLVVLLIGPEADDGGPSTAGLLLRLGIGVVFLVLAARQWRGRPAEGEDPVMPGWMSSVSRSSPLRAFGLAALLSSLNPKNLWLTIAAAASISAADLSVGGELGVLAAYVAVASASVAVPVAYLLVGGEGTATTLEQARTLLLAHGDVVMTVLFLVLGATLVGEGLGVAS